MPQRIPDRVPPITPQLAWRVAVLGGFAFVLFGIVFFRLWFLQVLSGEDYVSQARENRVRKIRIEAPRGDIVDRNRVELVTTKIAAVVQMLPNRLPESVRKQADDYRIAVGKAQVALQRAIDTRDAYDRQLKDDGKKSTKTQLKTLDRLKAAARKARPVPVPALPASEQQLALVYRRIADVLQDGITPRVIHRRVIRGIADAPYSNVTIKTDVDRAEFNYMRERAELFPGVVVEKRNLRWFPHNQLAAQLFGTVSEISEEQRGLKKYAGVAAGTRIGQSGLEERWDKYLRGTDGYSRVVVNAFGTRDDQRKTSVKNPVQGQRLRSTAGALLIDDRQRHPSRPRHAVHPLGERPQRHRRRARRIDHDDRLTRVGFLCQPQLERDRPQERYTHLVGEPLPTPFTEVRHRAAGHRIGEGAHILDDSEHRHADPFEHFGALERVAHRHLLRRRHDHRARYRDGLDQRELGVPGARRHVHQEIVELAPVDIPQELLNHLHDDGAAPDGRRIALDQEPDRHEFDAVDFQGPDPAAADDRLLEGSEHAGDVGAVDVRIHQPHSVTLTRQGDGQVGGDGGLPHSALPGAHRDDAAKVRLLAGLLGRDRSSRLGPGPRRRVGGLGRPGGIDHRDLDPILAHAVDCLHGVPRLTNQCGRIFPG